MNKILNLITVAGIIMIIFSANSPSLFAQDGTNSHPAPSGTNQNLGYEIPNPLKGGDTLFELLETLINDILLPIGGMLAVLSFIYAGFLYVTAQGNENKIAKAHKALLYTAIGTAVLLGSWAIASVIGNTINQLRV